MNIRPMQASDYDAVLALWQETEGVGLNESDARENVAAYLTRNPGMSRIATDPEGGVVGAVLCGHDGRRGYLHHLAVAARRRRSGVGLALVGACFESLRQAGIPKCNIFAYADNAAGQSFWRHTGWNARTELLVMQKQV
ncbi:MAG: GNAT family N-acetyltransferase [Verrucomicrobia bacterium]|nr:GNAT family N-acetyltransferase [Verrucomicrobiota bacterium]